MDDQGNEPVGVTEGLSPEDAANFSAQPAGEPASSYTANFDGDEIDGRRYSLGETIADGIDAGTIAYLVQRGRITPGTSDSAGSTSGGDGDLGPGGKAPAPAGDGAPQLTDEQQAEADKLVAANSKDQLLALAEDEGVEGVTADNNKAEIAAKIVANRSA